MKYKAVIEHREMTDEYEVELKEFWTTGYHSVRKAADTGAFLFSDAVNETLREFVGLKNENYDSYFDYLDSHFAVAEKCLKTVVASATKDLRVGDSWL